MWSLARSHNIWGKLGTHWSYRVQLRPFIIQAVGQLENIYGPITIYADPALGLINFHWEQSDSRLVDFDPFIL